MPKVLNRPVVIGGEDNLNPFFADELKKIVFSPDLGTIPAYACYQKRNLEEVIIPEGITEIGNYAFRYCSNLQELVLPEGITTLGSNSIDIGTSQTPATVNIPKSITSSSRGAIGQYCFHVYFDMTVDEWLAKTSVVNLLDTGYTSGNLPYYRYYFKNNEGEHYLLENLVISPGITTSIKSSAFDSMRSIKSITIPEGITDIGQNAFNGLPYLTEVSLPQSLRTVANYAFAKATSLKEIVIPKNVTGMYTEAFAAGSSSNKLTVIMEPTTPPSVGGSTFKKSYLNKIFVPTGTKAAYLARSDWSGYADYIFELNETVYMNVDSALLNNPNIVYSTDQGSTWNQFTSNNMELQYISTIHFKSTAADPVVLIGTTSGGAQIGTIANAQLIYTTTSSETIYLSTQANDPTHSGGI